MFEPALPPLAEWETFCVIVGSASAALTGLMFVVVALGAERTRSGAVQFSAFGTPTVVHFSAVVLICAVLSIPRHTVATLGFSLAAIGAVGIGFVIWAIRLARKQTDYRLVREDWMFHAVLPLCGHAAVLFAAIILFRAPITGLYTVGVSALALLFIGIHNAWDAAVYIASQQKPG